MRVARASASIVALLWLPVSIVGCAGIAPSSREPAPAWYLEPPHEAGALYATGEGTTQREAEKNARVGLAAQIRARVSSEMKLLQLHDENFHRLYTEQESAQHVDDLTISGSRVVHNDRRGTSHYALVVIDRDSVVTQQSEELAEDAHALRSVLEAANGERFDTWWRLARARGTARRLAGNLTLFAMLGVEEHEAERALLARYREAARHSAGDRRIQLLDRTRITGLREVLRQQLEHEGIRVVQGGRETSLVATTEYRSEWISGELYVDAVLWLRLRSAAGAILSQLRLRDQVVSLGGPSEGRQRAREALFRRLEETNVLGRLIEAA